MPCARALPKIMGPKVRPGPSGEVGALSGSTPPAERRSIGNRGGVGAKEGCARVTSVFS